MRPKLLDLFAGAGGTAMGYYRAGFDVFGVDNDPKPLRHYPFPHICADALEYCAEHGHEYDAIHASPPCQFYSRLRHLPWLRDKTYWRSVPPTRDALNQTDKPWVIENVEDCFDMPYAITLCGQMVGLPIFRHRQFEASFLLLAPPHEKHKGFCAHGKNSMAKRYAHGHVGIKEINRDSVAGHFEGRDRVREAMGIDWMNREELSQAIPPAYTEYVGKHLLAYLSQQELPFGEREEKHEANL